jgi:type VI secretion system protein ImpL
LRAQLEAELALLKDRLAAGLHSRLNEEFDVERRKRLFALPQELAGLAERRWSRCSTRSSWLAFRPDAIARHAARRLFHEWRAGRRRTAGRSGHLVPAAAAQPGLVFEPAGGAGSTPAQGQQGFFLQDVLTKVIIPEAHLVQARTCAGSSVSAAAPRGMRCPW